MTRRTLSQEGLVNSNRATGVQSNGSAAMIPRRSSLSSLIKPKYNSSSVVVVQDIPSRENEPVKVPSREAGLLQSTDKRRRYMRRGSKTSLMMRSGDVSGKMSLPAEWQQVLANYASSPQYLLDDSVQSACTAPATVSLSESEQSGPPPASQVYPLHEEESEHWGSFSSSSLGDLPASEALRTRVGESSPLKPTLASPLLNPTSSTVCLLTTALGLSCIEDESLNALK